MSVQISYKYETGDYADALTDLTVDIPSVRGFDPPVVMDAPTNLAQFKSKTECFDLAIDENAHIKCRNIEVCVSDKCEYLEF